VRGAHGPKRLTGIIATSIAVLIGLAGCLSGPERSSRLTYQLVTKLTVPVGQELAPTGIRYDRMENRSAYVVIDGQQALKKKGDSLSWSGTPREGVSLALKQRVLWYTEEELLLVGTAKVEVDDTVPTAGPIETTSPVKYSGPVAYGVRKGSTIPGSSLTYLGKTDDGAELGGLSEYPYRMAGDSIVWEGTLRPGVYSRLDLRVIQFDDRGLRVGGIVTLWIGP
jgi:hypothetical protein